MKTWTIEILENQNIFKDYFDSIGRSYTLLNKFDSIKHEVESFPITDIIYGSLYTLRKFSKHNRATYYDDLILSCINYYGYYGKYLINDDYCILPTKDCLRRKEWLFETFGQKDTIYSRPNRGDKVYSGAVVTYENFETDMGYILSRGIRDDDLIVFSSPKNIIDEYRCFVIDKKIVTSSKYYTNGVITIDTVVPDRVISLAEEIANVYSPFDAFVIDIGTTKENGFKLIEINSFASSGLYGCDPEKIVTAIDKL